MRERIFIDRLPFSSDEGGNQQQQSALRLMEIGHQHIHDAETETGNYDDAGADPEGSLPRALR